MTRVEICIGSSCHLKGAGRVLDTIRSRVKADGLGDKVELGGRFCIGKCTEGVCVTVGGEFYSVIPETADKFYEKEIKGRV